VKGRNKQARRKMRKALIPRYHYTDQVKENEVGGSSSTHGRGEKIVQCPGGKARRKETPRMTKAEMGISDENGSW
jgi:hypothetical protein